MLNKEGWYTQKQRITINEDRQLTIGLQKTATIKGAVEIRSNEKSYDVFKKVSGLSIQALSETAEVYNTKTDSEGSFLLYLPKGNYRVTLEKTGLSNYFTILNNNQRVEAVINEIKIIEFIIEVKEKRLEIQKFTSKGF